MAESINDKLIKLGVSYYDGTAPAAPPIRGIDGSTEDYNKVITIEADLSFVYCNNFFCE